MNESQAADLVRGSHSGLEPTYFKIWMPYSYVRLEHPKRSHVYLPLNRNYKPLGTPGTSHVDYKSYIETHAVAFSRDPASFSNVWWKAHESQFWLYDDGVKSRLDYFARLERLMLKNPTMVSA